MYSLKIWTHPSNGEIRVYLSGTTRSSIYLKQAQDGRVVWSSKANDTPHKFQTGDHYGKVAKDREAARAVAARYGIPLGDGSTPADWTRLLQIASDGVMLSPSEEA